MLEERKADGLVLSRPGGLDALKVPRENEGQQEYQDYQWALHNMRHEVLF